MPRTAAKVALPPEGTGVIVAPEVSFEPVKEVTTMNVDTDNDEEVELLDCGCDADNIACAMCADNGISTCVDCCNVSHCDKCSADLDISGCEHCGDVCTSCCDVTHCTSCGNDVDDMNCGYNDEVCSACCGCYYCEGCGTHQGPEYDSDNYCGDCNHCTSCGCSCEGSQGCLIKIAPWEERGIKVTTVMWAEHAYERGDAAGQFVPVWQQLWNIDQTIAPAEAMCDFYLLDGIAAGVFNGGPGILDDPNCAAIAADAKALQNALVERLDITFTNYVDMAVGGELRHHKAVGKSALRLDRTAAWSDWFYLRRLIGPQALLDAATVFRDFVKSGFGGEPWALPCELLHQRLTGLLSPHIFVDRVFTMQHNGGSLLNKIEWKRNDAGWTFQHMKHIGDAHASNPPGWGMLLTGCSTRVSEMFSEWWRAANRWRRLHTMERVPPPTWKSGGRREGRYWWVSDTDSIRFDLYGHPRWGWYENGENTFGNISHLYTPYVPDLASFDEVGKFSYDGDAYKWWARGGVVRVVGRKDVYVRVTCLTMDISMYRAEFATTWQMEFNRAQNASNKKLDPIKPAAYTAGKPVVDEYIAVLNNEEKAITAISSDWANANQSTIKFTINTAITTATWVPSKNGSDWWQTDEEGTSDE